MKRLVVVSICAVTIAAIVLGAYLTGLIGSEGTSYDPVIDPQNFSGPIDNPYFPLVPGTTFLYEGVSEDGPERNEMTVTNDTKVIMGVACVVVWDRVWLTGDLVEETYDWYSQDNDGNVWYFGEDSKELANGVVVSTEGSWEAGVDGAKPGIVMLAEPKIGDEYRQEYYKGEAEDMAEVLALDVTVTVPYGSYVNCLQTKDWTPLEKDVAEQKFYASGIGLVEEFVVEGGTGQMKLVSITTS
jgi:hypothetical protein